MENQNVNMKLKEYQTIIKKIAVYPKQFGYGYCMLGLIGEFEEFLDAIISGSTQRMIKECGDVWWYLTALCSEHGLNVEHTYPSTNSFKIDPRSQRALVSQFHRDLGALSETTKKYYRDGAFSLTQDQIKILVIDLAHTLRSIAEISKLDQEVIFETNYKKLMKRRETNTLAGSGDDRELHI